MTHQSIVVLLGAALVATQTPAPAELLFRDITAQSGVDFRHHAAPEKKYIVESMSGGVAMFDYDNDGLPDLYFVDSLTVETATSPRAARSALYRNLGGGRFADVTDKAGVGHPGRRPESQLGAGGAGVLPESHAAFAVRDRLVRPPSWTAAR